MARPTWKRAVEREYLETDREFIDKELPIGTVDGASFGLIADATRYTLARTEEDVHIVPVLAASEEILRSLAQSGSPVTRADAESAVARFAELWEAKIRARGKWEQVLETAAQHDEIATRQERPADPKRRRWPFGR